MKHIVLMTFFTFMLFSEIETTNADQPAVPEQFEHFDPSSPHTINFDVLTDWLRYVVVEIGISDRQSARISPSIGTRIAPKVKNSTVYEGNRVFFESLVNNEKAQQVLQGIRFNLEQIPTKAPLRFFSRDEQLAYWLNLYNVTVLNEIVKVYPVRSLEELLVGEDSLLSKQLLNVAGISLSLNDIQFTILKQNYDADPLIIYGLYQGIIGGPNIRKAAYTGASVYSALEDNAIEFINSNRGTDKFKAGKVSSLYARNKAYFPNFNEDLSAHILKYLEGYDQDLNKFKRKLLKPVINDWTVTDLYGTFPVVRNGIATNPAALLGAVVSTTPGDPAYGGGTMGATVPSGGSALLPLVNGMNYMSPQTIEYLAKLKMKWVETNLKNGIVTMEELGEVPVDPETD